VDEALKEDKEATQRRKNAQADEALKEDKGKCDQDRREH